MIELPWQVVFVGYTESNESGPFRNNCDGVYDQIEAMKKGWA